MALDAEMVDELLRRTEQGDSSAAQRLLAGHRDRLKNMVRVRLDRRMVARIDPSDVVQEALAEAAQRLPRYPLERPIPFYPWLRQLAWKRLEKLHERHLLTQRRAVGREERLTGHVSDESVLELAGRIAAPGSSPSERLVRDEVRRRVHEAIAELSDLDRELLVLRYLEQLPAAEVRAILEIGEEAYAKRHLRAMQRLRRALEQQED
jgi:RNA polymerase sigma-70 factor (ECF subfamily)